MTSIDRGPRLGGPAPVDAAAARLDPPAPGSTPPTAARRLGLATPKEDVAALLARAGLEVTAAGVLVVRDSAAVDEAPAVEDAHAAAPTYGTAETHLPPPSPPRVTLDAEAREGAESFASNVDVVFGAIFAKPGNGSARAGGAAGAGRSGDTPAGGELKRGELERRELAELSADLLVAAFLELNISDPSNDPEVHQQLQELASALRQRAIDDARLQEKQASAAMGEARAFADRAAFIGKIVTAVLLVVAVVAAVFTAGASLALFGAAFASFASAHAAAVLVVCALAALVASLTGAAANRTAADKTARAQEEAVDVKVAERLAAVFQEQVEDENDIVRLILESKNQVVDAVIEMMKAMFASRSKLMAASMAR